MSSAADYAELVCTELSPDLRVAFFVRPGQEGEVFAYLPHVPGLNPFLLRVSDRLEGRLVPRHGRLELVEARGQQCRRGSFA